MSNKALLVGINRYKLPDCNLNGCINDVTNMRHILTTYYGFSVKDIRVVVDERATRDGILKRLDWLVRDSVPGDRLFFHFSGHGSQVRDRDGDELKDHLDEILCPHDMMWDGNYIVDDELEKIFSKVPGEANLDVFLDCCHSGTATRFAPASFECPSENLPRGRFIQPPADILCREEEDLLTHRLFAGQINHVLFSGCRDNQTSADAFIDGHYNGAFTYYFCKHIRDTGGNVTRKELLKRVRASLKFNRYDQEPQLEGPKEKLKKGILK